MDTIKAAQNFNQCNSVEKVIDISCILHICNMTTAMSSRSAQVRATDKCTTALLTSPLVSLG